MRKFAKLMALILALALVAAMFVGCQPTDNNTETTTAAATEETTADTTAATEDTTAATDDTTAAATDDTTQAVTEATTAVVTLAPGVTATVKPTATKGPTARPTATTKPGATPNYNGYKFKISSNQYPNHWNVASTRTCYDTFWAGIKSVEKTYNVTLVRQALADPSTDAITKAMASGTKYSDLIQETSTVMGTLAGKGFLWRLDNIKTTSGVDLNIFDRSFSWVTGTKALDINGANYSWLWASDIQFPQFGIITYFNKSLVKQATGSDTFIYDLVKTGKWTHAAFRSLAKSIAKDTNGDGAPEIVGAYWTHPNQMQAFLLSGGDPFTKYSNGKYIYSGNTPGIKASLQLIQDMINVDRSAGARMPNYNQAKIYLNVVTDGWDNVLWKEGKLGLAIHNWLALSDLSGNPNTNFQLISYGVAPLPKGPSQATGKTYIGDIFDARAYGIIKNYTLDEVKRTVVIAKALSKFLNNDKWTPILNERLGNNPNDIEMLNSYIFPALRYEPMLSIQGLAGYRTYRGYVPGMCEMVATKQQTVQQGVDSIQAKSQTAYDQIFNKK